MDYGPPKDFAPLARGKRGVGWHPHRGFETVTLAWEGAVAHRDNAGHAGMIGPGDAQWMTAGTGIFHEEYHEEEFTRRGGRMHMMQLWVNLPRKDKMAPPGYQPLTRRDSSRTSRSRAAAPCASSPANTPGRAGRRARSRRSPCSTSSLAPVRRCRSRSPRATTRSRSSPRARDGGWMRRRDRASSCCSPTTASARAHRDRGRARDPARRRADRRADRAVRPVRDEHRAESSRRCSTSSAGIRAGPGVRSLARWLVSNTSHLFRDGPTDRASGPRLRRSAETASCFPGASPLRAFGATPAGRARSRRPVFHTSLLEHRTVNRSVLWWLVSNDLSRSRRWFSSRRVCRQGGGGAVLTDGDDDNAGGAPASAKNTRLLVWVSAHARRESLRSGPRCATLRECPPRSRPCSASRPSRCAATRRSMLDDISWEVRSGEHWAVLGANGLAKRLARRPESLLDAHRRRRGGARDKRYGVTDWARAPKAPRRGQLRSPTAYVELRARAADSGERQVCSLWRLVRAERRRLQRPASSSSPPTRCTSKAVPGASYRRESGSASSSRAP